MFNKTLVVGVIFLFIGVSVDPSISANINDILILNQEDNIENSLSPDFILSMRFGFGYPSFYLYISNKGYETFRGNISCKFTINASIMIIDGSINITDYYVEIEPNEEVPIFRSLYLGFGKVNATIEIFHPFEWYQEFDGFLLFIFLFLWFKHVIIV